MSSPRNAIRNRLRKKGYIYSGFRHTIHATGDFTSLLVTPANRSEVSLVVHETTIEEWLDVGVCRLDMDLSARGWVLEVLEPMINLESSSQDGKGTLLHGDVLARRQQSVVGIGTGND